MECVLSKLSCRAGAPVPLGTPPAAPPAPAAAAATALPSTEPPPLTARRAMLRARWNRVEPAAAGVTPPPVSEKTSEGPPALKVAGVGSACGGNAGRIRAVEQLHAREGLAGRGRRGLVRPQHSWTGGLDEMPQAIPDAPPHLGPILVPQPPSPRGPCPMPRAALITPQCPRHPTLAPP